MRAIVQNGYGSPENVLALREIATPTIDDQQVLVRIHAASVNALDWHLTRGRPYLTRMAGDKDGVRGVDLAGRVEAVGKNVTRFKPGDDVFGGGDGSFAEYTGATWSLRVSSVRTRSSIIDVKTSRDATNATTSSSTSGDGSRCCAAGG